MKKRIITGLFALLCVVANAQDTFQKLIEVGITNHDSGKYEAALKYYKKALEIKPNSNLANYEMSLTYFIMKDYKNAIIYSDKVLAKGEKYLMPAYVNKGSSLDMLGKTKKSIKVFQKAIEQLGDNYLLHFNLAINYLKLNEMELGKIHLKKTVEDNPFHTSAHFYLSTINNGQGHRIQALLASYYFLMLEPDTIRAEEIYNILNYNLRKGVTKQDDNNITLNLNLDNDSEFGALETMLCMLEASKSIEENKDKTEAQLFVENTTSFFQFLGEFNGEKKESIWQSFYIPFFYKIANSEHIEVFCKMITRIDIKSQNWIENNEDKVNLFVDWLEKEYK